LTLPEDIQATLKKTNGSAFEAKLAEAGQVENLRDFPKITIFALSDSDVASVGADKLTKSALDQHVILGFVSYTPDVVLDQLYDTASGGKVKITLKNGNYFINDVRVVQSNIITKNGIIHYVQSVWIP
jgi:uncharacterized surface protein with fasciclin (FAS1) repeats